MRFYPTDSFSNLLVRILNTLFLFWMYMFYPILKIVEPLKQGAPVLYFVGLMLVCILAFIGPFWVGRRFSFPEHLLLLLLLVCLTLWSLPFSAAQGVLAFLAVLSLGLTSIVWFASTRKLAGPS